mgnify:FL=1
MKVYIGADHGGFELKKKIFSWLQTAGYTVTDCGNSVFNAQDDYPTFAFAVSEAVAKDEKSKGVIICRSAAGAVIAANKVTQIRAVAVFDPKAALHARAHNDANVLGLSGDWTDANSAAEILKIFLATEFSKETRHARRIAQITAYEKSH